MILDEIADKTRSRVEGRKKSKSLDELIEETGKLSADKSFSFEKALRAPGISFICEIKKASPSKGIIDNVFDYMSIASDYEKAGASAISVLTEPYYFLGDDLYLKRIASSVNIPVLRKDFIIDSYQIYESRLLGASAILLICALLDTDTLRQYISIAGSLGLSALVEAHTEAEVKSALDAGARIIGVNNRNLKTFDVDISNSISLRKLVPKSILFVSESGIEKPEDIAALRANGTDAVLIGEMLMKSQDKAKVLSALKSNQ